MKSIQSIQFVMAIFVGLIMTSCSEDDAVVIDPVVSEQYANLFAEQTSDYTTDPPTITGDYIKFSFSTGTVVTGDDWDIAFRGTTILVNGGEQYSDDEPARTATAGVYIASGTFNEIETVNTAEFQQDSAEGLAITTGSGNGWYNYNFENHSITPIPGKIIVVRTHDGKYAKMEIVSYYKDNPEEPNPEVDPSQYYTFNYAYQPNEGTTTFE